MLPYQAHFEPADEGGFVITFPEFGWGVTQGESEAEGLAMAADLLQVLIKESIRKGEALPAPKRHRDNAYRPIHLPALQSTKAELYSQFHRSGMRKAALARRLRIPRANVDRLFDLSHHSRLDQLEAAFRAFGKNLRILVADAA